MPTSRSAGKPAPASPGLHPFVPFALPIAPLLASDQGEARVGPILALPAVIDALGVSPQRVFARARVPLRTFDDPDNRIAYEKLGRLAAVAAEMSGCDHFGLLVGERFTLAGFGPLGELMRHAPTVGEALRVLVLHLYLHDRMAVPFLAITHAGEALLGYSIYQQGVAATRFIYDGAIAIVYRVLQALCGPRFRARRVDLTHAAPADRTPYRRVYGTAVFFDAEVAGVRFDAAWLDRPIEGANATVHRALASAFREQRLAHPLSFTEEVLCVLHRLVLTGDPSSARVAQLFGIGERTLRHRLQAEGANLAALLRDTRRALAQQLVHDTQMPLSTVASALAYADLASFSRAFRAWTGDNPLHWRAMHRPARGRAGARRRPR